MGTLSWFWVPVLAHAHQILGVPSLPLDQYLYNCGATFSLSGLVGHVHQLILSGNLQIMPGEVQQLNGGVYFHASVQDRLMNILRSGQLGSNILSAVVHWLDHVYYSQIQQLIAYRSPTARQYLAHPWAPHFYLCHGGQQQHIAGPVGPVYVWIDQ